MIRGHGDAVSGVADGVVHAVELAGVGHDVEGEVERASPDVFDFGVAELGIDVDHAAAQDFGAAADGLVVLGEEGGASAEQHTAVGREAVVVEIILRVVDHAVARAEFVRQSFRKDLGCMMNDPMGMSFLCRAGVALPV